MDINAIRTVAEIVCLGAFVGIVWWAYAPRRRATLEQIARSVLDDDHMEEIESRLLRRAAKRQQQREAEEMARVQRGES